jgi:PAS domain S-box-containing protein
MTFKLTEQNYHDLFENASDAMWVQDIAGNFIVVNKACEKLTGFNESELHSRNVKEFLVGDSLKLALKLKQSLLQNKEYVQPYKQKVIRKDGNIRTVKMSTSLVMINEKPAGFQHVARDVTEEQSMADMLSEIMNGSPIPTFVINTNHKITHWNAALESMTGLRSSKMLGSDDHWQAFYTKKRPTMADLIINGFSDREFQKFYKSKYKKSSLVEGAYEADNYLPSLSTAGRWLHFTASPIKNGSGQTIAALEALQDITEERRMQESMRFYVQLITRAQEEERKRLARDLHDDLSSSLLLLIQRLDSAVTGNHTKQSNITKPVLEELRSQTVEALEHVRRYVQNLRPRILDDLGLIASIEWMADDMQKKYGIVTNISISEGEKALPADVQLILFRIAQEALSNIRRHAKATNVEIRLQQNEQAIVMTINDNGCGFEIPKRLEELVGIGHLGIMGMAERAKLLGGSIEIKSTPNKGTSVVTNLPLYKISGPDLISSGVGYPS